MWSKLPSWNANALYPRLQTYTTRLQQHGINTARLEPQQRRTPSRRQLYDSTVLPSPLPASEVPAEGDTPAQCFPIHQATQRDVNPANRVILQYNIEQGGGDRLEAVLDWIRSRRPDVVGLCELNGWDDDSQRLHKSHTASLSKRAGRAGMAFAAMLPAHEGYNIGIFAARPITVLETDVQDFERGLLVVEVAGDVFMVVHLNAHDHVKRATEVRIVTEKVAHYTAAGKNVVVMGDMNTLSPLDREWHQQEQLLQWLTDPKTPQRLRDKYVKTVDGAPAIDYVPMMTFFNNGMHDLCTTQHWDRPNAPHQAPTPCLYTEPTDRSMVPEVNGKVPPFRLDYVLGNSHVVKRHPDFSCAVVQTAATAKLSDHFPLECRYSISAQRRS